MAAGVDGSTGKVSTGPALIQALDGLVASDEAAGPAAVIGQAVGVVDILGTATGSPVVPPGALPTGLALGSIAAIAAAAEAESQIVQGAFAPGSTLGPADLAMVDRVLDDPTLGLALRTIDANFAPAGPYGQALLEAVRVAEDLAAQIDPNVPGSAGAGFLAYLPSAPLHGA